MNESLHGADLNDAELRDHGSFVGRNVSRSTMVYAHGEELDLSGATLEHVEMRGAFLKGAQLPGAKLSDVSLQEADLSGCDLSVAFLERCNLTGANLSGANLGKATFKNCILPKADLRNSKLDEAKFLACDMPKVDLTGASLDKATFENCILSKADLRRSKLDEATFLVCEMLDVNLTGVNLRWRSAEGSQLRPVCWDALAPSDPPHTINLAGVLMRRAETQNNLAKRDLRHLNLKGADLVEMDLEGCNLEGVVLSSAKVAGCNFQNAKLRGVVADEVRFNGCQLGGDDGLDLSDAQLRGATFTKNSLARTRFARADLTSARLEGTCLVEAIFEDAVLDKAVITGGDLTGATFFNASLKGTTIDEQATGLLAGALGGSDVTNASLPAAIARFDAIGPVEQASRNTRAIFLSLLAVCAYSELIVLSTTDAQLILNYGQLELPLLGTLLPPKFFYAVTPLVILSTYFYFHFYLVRLWERIASLPARMLDGRTIDETAYPWLLTGLVRGHLLRVADEPMKLRGMQAAVTQLLAYWIVPAAMLMFAGRCFVLRNVWLTSFHMTCAALAFGAALYFRHVRRLLISHREKRERLWVAGTLLAWCVALGAAILFSIAWSYSMTGASAEWIERGPLAYVMRTQAKIDIYGADLRGRDLRGVNLSGARLVAAKFSDADLSGADLSNANLVGADLAKALLYGADLSGARLADADLRYARLGEATLHGSDFTRANLSRADLSNVNRPRTQEGGQASSNCRDGRRVGPDFTGAKLVGARLCNACLSRATLSSAKLSGASYSMPPLTLGTELPPGVDVSTRGMKLVAACPRK